MLGLKRGALCGSRCAVWWHLHICLQNTRGREHVANNFSECQTAEASPSSSLSAAPATEAHHTSWISLNKHKRTRIMKCVCVCDVRVRIYYIKCEVCAACSWVLVAYKTNLVEWRSYRSGVFVCGKMIGDGGFLAEWTPYTRIKQVHQRARKSHGMQTRWHQNCISDHVWAINFPFPVPNLESFGHTHNLARRLHTTLSKS